jgi:uncharacterized protein (TIGR00251 family)
LSDDRLNLRASKTGVRLEVEVKVRASRTAILGIKSERLSVALAAPPVDNAANEALCRLLADQLSIPRKNVQIVGGDKSRRKILEIRDIGPDELMARLAPHL